MDTVCFKLPNIDRIGLVQDISRILVAESINIVSMEVQPNCLYLEIEKLPDEKRLFVIDELKNIPQIMDVESIKNMPRQQIIQQLRAVLTSVSEGIVAINCRQRIIQYNPAAEKIIRLPRQQVIGQLFSEIFPADKLLLDSLKNGVTYNNREIISERTKSHYLTSGRPIQDPTGQITGAVCILKDIGDVRKLVDSFTGYSQQNFHNILYRSETIKKIIKTIKAIAPGNSTVLIRGETGTGKELVARAIHAASSQVPAKFVPLNCAVIPEALLESELFGYQKGAFTGADKNGKTGLFEFADGGTLFLDEISELPLPLQAKLLRVLQDGKVRKLGGTEEKAVNVRIIAATNQNLEEMIDKGRFRPDLYYRLNVIPIFIPPLRERREDIPLLAQHFSQRFSMRLHKTVSTISETALTKLTQYDWPGNIRELENVIERAVNLVTGSVILAEHISFDREMTAEFSVSGVIAYGSLADAVARAEYDILVNSMRQHRTTRSLGRALGLSHTAVIKKMQKYGLKFPAR